MNNKMKWIGVLAAVLLVVSCFTPWVFIESKNITVSGIDSGATNYGKPGYLHFICCVFFLAFTLIPKIWAKRINLLVVGVNIAWAARNYFLLTACSGGECPQSQTGLWLMMLSSLIMLITAFFPDITIDSGKKN
jgi:divalent metal cation (Fe/Co/Zn/Cd) transporter